MSTAFFDIFMWGAHLSFWRLAILPGRTRPVWRGLSQFRPEPALPFSSGFAAEALEMAAPGGVASPGRKSAAYPRLQKLRCAFMWAAVAVAGAGTGRAKIARITERFF
jgi:hypothetical protein